MYCVHVVFLLLAEYFALNQTERCNSVVKTAVLNYVRSSCSVHAISASCRVRDKSSGVVCPSTHEQHIGDEGVSRSAFVSCYFGRFVC